MSALAAREAKVRTLIKLGACASAGGIGLAVLGDDAIARWVTLAGMVLLILGLHRFGRLGAR